MKEEFVSLYVEERLKRNLKRISGRASGRGGNRKRRKMEGMKRGRQANFDAAS